MSNIFKYVAQHDAVTTNPTRNTQALSGKPKRSPRALTAAEYVRWLTQLADSEAAARRDLPDLTGFLLGEGCRLGEALVVAWNSIDLDQCTVEIQYTVVRLKGGGLVRKGTKTSTGERILRLPAFVVAILRRRP
jgi:integrase